MKTILFVDDEARILDALKRMLRGLRREWKMAFVTSGAEALAYLDENPVDVVVSDMRMPGMDGSELLQKVRVRFPSTVRIILSGQCDRESVFKCLGPTHQFLTKPCDSETLKSTVARACRLRDHLPNTWSKQVVSSVQSLPSVPENHEELVREVTSETPSMQRVEKIIAGDPAMVVKVLQLVNSGFLGTPQSISDPVQAVHFLGLDTIKPLVLETDVFYPWRPDKRSAPYFDELARRGMAVARAAREIAESETEDPDVIQDAWLVGLIRNIGILVLLENAGETYLEALELACRERQTLPEVEKRVLNMSHDHVGAYLLGLWGLPDRIVKAVAWHLSPSDSPEKTFGPLAAVHAANALVQARLTEARPPLDMDYLEQLGLADRVDRWRAIRGETVLEGAT